MIVAALVYDRSDECSHHDQRVLVFNNNGQPRLNKFYTQSYILSIETLQPARN